MHQTLRPSDGCGMQKFHQCFESGMRNAAVPAILGVWHIVSIVQILPIWRYHESRASTRRSHENAVSNCQNITGLRIQLVLELLTTFGGRGDTSPLHASDLRLRSWMQNAAIPSTLRVWQIVSNVQTMLFLEISKSLRSLHERPQIEVSKCLILYLVVHG